MNITKNTTLEELINCLGGLEKEEKRPTAKALRETAGEPVADMDGCQVYANGYAVYSNGSGTTVLWLKDCLNFTYRFVQPKDGEKESITGKSVLDEEALGGQPWYFGVMLRGDHQVEENMMNRKGDRRGQRTDMKYDCDEAEVQEDEEDTYLHNLYSWRDTPFAENPEDAYIRKETQQEMLEKLSDTQREAFVLYYRDGLTRQEIADNLKISRQGVDHRLEKALKRLKKIS